MTFICQIVVSDEKYRPTAAFATSSQPQNWDKDNSKVKVIMSEDYHYWVLRLDMAPRQPVKHSVMILIATNTNAATNIIGKHYIPQVPSL